MHSIWHVRIAFIVGAVFGYTVAPGGNPVLFGICAMLALGGMVLVDALMGEWP